MQTEKRTRAEQARINGAKSNGPATPKGLQRCRLASLKHGAYVAAVAVIPGEDQRQYEGMWLSLVDQYQPRNLAETSVLASLLDAIWRHRRLSRAANNEILRKMESISNDSALNLTDPADIHLRAETESAVVDRIESRARHYMRQIASLQRILESMQKRTVSSEASRMSNEILDLVAEELDAEAVLEPAEPPTAPALPGKQPPRRENLPRKARKRLR